MVRNGLEVCLCQCLFSFFGFLVFFEILGPLGAVALRCAASRMEVATG